MAGDDFRIFAEYYDQIYLKWKDYKGESEVIKKVINELGKSSRTLLDVGCGTGEHLRYLSRDFKCKGIDINKGMIDIAKTKVKDAKFEVKDMIDFKLKEKFDVVTCLFSSIGYVRHFRNLAKTLKNFNKHLNKNGLAIVESWVFKKDFRKGNYRIDTYEDERIKLARMGTSRLTASQWLVNFHYLIGTEGEIKHVKETHRMLAADYEDYVKAFDLAGFSDIRFLDKDLWTQCRGLFVAVK
jgi:SAM-dependent methyltransferase